MKFDFTAKEQKENILKVFEQFAYLKKIKNIQISTMLLILKKEVVIHHRGLFPIIKKAIKILFLRSTGL